jgi:hypothetical protein
VVNIKRYRCKTFLISPPAPSTLSNFFTASEGRGDFCGERKHDKRRNSSILGDSNGIEVGDGGH